MITKIQKWGNSAAIRIPRSLMKSLNINHNDTLIIVEGQGSFTVHKENKHITLKERLEKYYGKELDLIETIKSDEIDWGNPTGNEIW